MSDANHNSPPSERPSKSQRKRDMTALQDLGKILVELSAPELAQIPLPELLADAVQAARSIKDHEGKRRQMQYIGRIMRDVDPLPIQAAIDKIQHKNSQLKAHFHLVERWRDRLIAEGDPQLEEFHKQFSNADRQHLRQLTRNAQQKKSGADTELFRYLRQIIEPK